MADGEIRLDISANLDKIKQQLASMGIPVKVESAGADKKVETELKKQSEEGKVQTDELTKSAKSLVGIFLIVSALEPILRPILALIKILVLIIFLPLLPILKIAMQALAGLAKVAAPTSEAQKAAQPLATANMLIGGIIGFLVAGPFGAILGAAIGSLLTQLAIDLGDFLGQLIKDIGAFLATINWKGLIEGISTAIGGFLESLFSALPKEFQDAWIMIADALDWIVGWFSPEKGPWKQIQTALDTVADWMGVGGLWDLIKAALGDAKDFLENSWNDIFIALGAMRNQILEIVDSFFAVKGAIDVFLRNAFGIGSNRGLPRAGGLFRDFVMRPGQAAVPFSSSDTIVGFKGGGGGGMGGISFSPTYNVGSGTDKNGFKRMLEEHDRAFLAKLRRQGTFGGRIMNA